MFYFGYRYELLNSNVVCSKIWQVTKRGVIRFSLGLYSKRGEKAPRRVKILFKITELHNIEFICLSIFSDVIFSKLNKNISFENIEFVMHG